MERESRAVGGKENLIADLKKISDKMISAINLLKAMKITSSYGCHRQKEFLAR
jgi:hypothetical protein